MTARLFVAVVPPPEVIRALDGLLEPRRDSAPELNWTVPEGWHLTCAFLAAVPESAIDELTEALQRVADRTAPFRLELGGAGAFPNPTQAKALWLGASVGEDELRHLAGRCRAAISHCGLPVEGERTHPHLTLARCRPMSARRWLTILDALPHQSWRVDAIELISSRGLRGGAGYQQLARLPLRAEPAAPAPQRGCLLR